MDIPVLQPPPRWWKCPSCAKVARTFDPDPTAVQFHHCRLFATAAIPMVEVRDFDAEPDVKRVVEKSEDYISGKRSSPVTGIHTFHSDGRQDATVFAEAATTDAAALDANSPPPKAPANGATFYAFWGK